jgi:hypothetical protein
LSHGFSVCGLCLIQLLLMCSRVAFCFVTEALELYPVLLRLFAAVSLGT